jgi:hypothetical protein
VEQKAKDTNVKFVHQQILNNSPPLQPTHLNHPAFYCLPPFDRTAKNKDLLVNTWKSQ